jgi:ABC-type Fe3+-citrate transport system substrate-binding protein
MREQAEARFAEHRRTLDATRAKLEGVTDTIAFLRIRKKELRVVTPEFGYVGPFLYGDLGLTPASFIAQLKDQERVGYAIISQEVVPQIDADRLFYLADDPETERELTSNRLWQQVPAVAAGQLTRVEALVWQTTGILANEAKMRDALRALGA